MLLCTYVNLKNQFFYFFFSLLSQLFSLSTSIKALASVGFVFGWLPWDSVAGFSPPSRSWLQTKWVVVGLGLPAWVWWLWVWVCQRGCGGYGWLSWLRRHEWVLGGCREWWLLWWPIWPG